MRAGPSRALRQSGEGRPPHERQLLRICGPAAVRALFERDPGRVERLFFEDRMKSEIGPMRRTLARDRKPYRQVDGAELARVAGTVLHGGIVAIARPQPLVDLVPAPRRNGHRTASLC